MKTGRTQNARADERGEFAAPTLENVARVAGVSTATISRALNSPQVVTPETRERVQRAIESTGYVPNLLAGGLAAKRSRLVAALVPGIATSFFNATIEAISRALASAGYLVVLGLTGYESEGADATITSLLSRRPDALILTSAPADARTRARLRRAHLTVIETWDLPRKPLDVAIGFSHWDAGRALADFVVERGFGRPLVITHGLSRGRARMEGFLERCRELRVRAPSCDVCVTAPFSIDGRERLGRFLDQGGRADVVLCSSDLIAQGVLAEAARRGLSCPGDLAVVGFGNTESSALTVPALTTVRIDGTAIGERAAEVLLRRSRGQQPATRRIDIGFEIIARESA